MITNYPTSRDRKYAGSLSYQRTRGLVHSRICASTAGIEFGSPAFTVNGASDDSECTSDPTSRVIIGIALRDHGQGMTFNLAYVPNSAVDARYIQRSNVSVIDMDCVVIQLSTSGTYRAPVHYDVGNEVYQSLDPIDITSDHILVGHLMETMAAPGLANVWIDTKLALGTTVLIGKNIINGPTDAQALKYDAINDVYESSS